MTERGGLYYDYGLCKGNPGETTDVSILDDGLYNERWKQYSLDSETLTMHDAWLVDSNEVQKARVEDGHLVPEAG